MPAVAPARWRTWGHHVPDLLGDLGRRVSGDTRDRRRIECGCGSRACHEVRDRVPLLAQLHGRFEALERGPHQLLELGIGDGDVETELAGALARDSIAVCEEALVEAARD